MPAVRRLLNVSPSNPAVPTVTSLSGREGGESSANATVLQTIRNDWGTGQTDDITIRNTGTSTISGWTVEFDADFGLTGLWDARLVSHSGTHYVFKSIPGSPRAVINSRAQITFGFNTSLDPDTDATAIRNIKLNGQALTGSGDPTPPVISPGTHGTIKQTIRNFWGTGDTIDLTIKNTGTTPMNGWIVTFTSDFEVTEIGTPSSSATAATSTRSRTSRTSGMRSSSRARRSRSGSTPEWARRTAPICTT